MTMSIHPVRSLQLGSASCEASAVRSAHTHRGGLARANNIDAILNIGCNAGLSSALSAPVCVAPLADKQNGKRSGRGPMVWVALAAVLTSMGVGAVAVWARPVPTTVAVRSSAPTGVDVPVESTVSTAMEASTDLSATTSTVTDSVETRPVTSRSAHPHRSVRDRVRTQNNSRENAVQSNPPVVRARNTANSCATRCNGDLQCLMRCSFAR
jgi:hypothetical protein